MFRVNDSFNRIHDQIMSPFMGLNRSPQAPLNMPSTPFDWFPRVIQDRSQVGSPHASEFDLGPLSGTFQKPTTPRSSSQFDRPQANDTRSALTTDGLPPILQAGPAPRLTPARTPSRGRSAGLTTGSLDETSQGPQNPQNRQRAGDGGFGGALGNLVDAAGALVQAVVHTGKAAVKVVAEGVATVIEGVGQAIAAPFRWLGGLFG